MNISKELRNLIYIETLQVYKNEIIAQTNLYGQMSTGICAAMRDVAFKHKGLNPYYFMRSYPEIYRHKTNNFYYWPVENTEIRIEVLKQAILETNTNQNEKD